LFLAKFFLFLILILKRIECYFIKYCFIIFSRDAVVSLVSCQINSLTSIEGEASASNRKSKLFFFYEWEIKAEWKGNYIFQSDILVLVCCLSLHCFFSLFASICYLYAVQMFKELKISYALFLSIRSQHLKLSVIIVLQKDQSDSAPVVELSQEKNQFSSKSDCFCLLM